jgi:hypothetical protein
MSGALVALVAALGLGAVVFGLYLVIPRIRQSGGNPAAAAKIEDAAVARGRADHPLAKHLELTGLRVSEDARQNLKVTLVVVNHSAAALPDLELAVQLLPKTAKAGDAPMSEFNVKAPALGPFEAKEISTIVKTKLRAYELPDWQFLRADFLVVSPQ